MTKRFKEICVVCNTHWDREFRLSFQRTRMLLVKMMDYLLETLEREKRYASYTMDSHSIMIEDYLQIRPENEKRIARLAKARRLLVGPWYTLPDIPNIGQESVVRNLLWGHRIGDRLGHTMKIGYTPCSWGQTGQLPQIYAGFDIHDILFYRGISPHECDAEFRWQSPDGTEALGHRFALYARYNYYYIVMRQATYGRKMTDKGWSWGRWGEAPLRLNDPAAGLSNFELLEPDAYRYNKEAVIPAIEEMLAIEGPHFVAPYFLAMHGHDISWPSPMDVKTISDANALMPEGGPKVVQTDLEDYCAKVRRDVDWKRLVLLKGERRTNLKAGMWTYLLPATISARTYLKVMDFRTETKLVQEAEPLAAAAMALGVPYPAPYLHLAWKYLMGNHTHDAVAGCAPDHVTDDVMYRYRQSQEISDGLIEESLKELARRMDCRKFDDQTILLGVFNTLPTPKDDVVTVSIDVNAERAARSLVIRDAQGREYPYQVVQIAPDGAFVDSYWDVPSIYETTRLTIRFRPGEIPALGYRVFTVEPSPEVNRATGTQVPAAQAMENEFLRAQVNPDGTVDLLHKATGAAYGGLGYLLDQGEAGNAWRHAAPVNDSRTTSLGAPARITLLEDGPLSTSYRADLAIRVPEGNVSDDLRSDRLVEVPASIVYTLKKGVARLEMDVTVDNRAKDHWLRMIFPTGIRTDKSGADSHFDLVERAIALPNCDDWKEPVVGTYPLQTFVDLTDGRRGLAVLTEGLREFEVFDDEPRSVAITLLRAVPIKLEVTDTKKQLLPDTGPQCPGRSTFRLAVYSHKGDWRAGRCFAAAREFTVPLRCAQFGKTSGTTLPMDYGFLEVSEGVVTSAVKKAERDDALILRVFNPSDRTARATVRLAAPIRKVELVSLNEEPIRRIGSAARSFSFPVGRKKICTFKVALR
jgi:hypothetical protein